MAHLISRERDCLRYFCARHLYCQVETGHEWYMLLGKSVTELNNSKHDQFL